MNTDLMCAASMQNQPDTAEMPVIAPFNRGFRDGGLPIIADIHFLAMPGMPANGLINTTRTPCGDTTAPCEILSIHIMPEKHACQTEMSLLRFGNDQTAGCTFIQTVYDTRTFHAVDTGKVRTMG